MYNTPFPGWADATSTSDKDYNGNLVYAYAKRGQVLLCERWAKAYPEIPIVTCHPGWTSTEGVELAFGSQKMYLEPMRTTWQGAEGIIWLCVAPSKEIESGAFYLDRSPCRKHISGPFFTEGSYTKNTPEEVDLMLKNLELWSSGDIPNPTEETARFLALKKPLAPSETPINIDEFMGRWYVLAGIPSSLEIGNMNPVENYEWCEENNQINMLYQYISSKGCPSTSKMRGLIKNPGINTFWEVDPKVWFYWPLNLSYLILHFSPHYCVIGVPDRSYLWIMTREKPCYTDKCGVVLGDLVEEERRLREQKIFGVSVDLAARLGYDPVKIVRIPWVKELEEEMETI
eukprot:TRINITY_DN5309_c0_g1_i2.p1 TRINITY_DN5309_c0_g1~~TRINITY_DN5309_c0_g1_i2.p1  ORF type:complete len:344 (+),score=58.57 TRINITY_DN5309_c0_g1_i2:591-1622(+)